MSHRRSGTAEGRLPVTQWSGNDIPLHRYAQVHPSTDTGYVPNHTEGTELADSSARQPLVSADQGLSTKDGAVPITDAASSSQHTLDKPHGKQSRWGRWEAVANRQWIYESTAIVVSIACFVALVVVLRKSDGKEQTKWFYDRLTLNGLIALLSTFIRASMMFAVGAGLGQMKWNFFSPRGSRSWEGRRLGDLDTFDQASRGPMGSLKLLTIRTKPHIGLIGALITIFTLAFDTFAQEVVILRFKNEAGVSGATLGEVLRSENYDRWTKEIQETNWVNDLNTIAAEYNGIFNYQNITAPTAQCSTGNCTWPIVPSLGVCGSCTDVTKEMNYTCVGPTDGGSTDSEYLNCTYTLSDGQGYSFWQDDQGAVSMQGGNLAFAVDGWYNSAHYNESNYMYLDTWLMMNATQSPPTATTCGLWFCVQAYNISVSNGVQTQQIVGNWSESTYSRWNFSNEEWYNFTNVPKEMEIGDPYAIAGGVMIAFDQNGIFEDGNVTFGMDSMDFYYYTSVTIRSLMSIADYHSWIDLFAMGMSNNVRATGTARTPASKYAGEVFSSVPYVHVRWPWLVFPAGMVTASVLFLIACIWQTKRLHVQPYKSDALALLLATLKIGEEGHYIKRRELEEERVWLDTREEDAAFRRPVAVTI